MTIIAIGWAQHDAIVPEAFTLRPHGKIAVIETQHDQHPNPKDRLAALVQCHKLCGAIFPIAAYQVLSAQHAHTLAVDYHDDIHAQIRNVQDAGQFSLDLNLALAPADHCASHLPEEGGQSWLRARQSRQFRRTEHQKTARLILQSLSKGVPYILAKQFGTPKGNRLDLLVRRTQIAAFEARLQENVTAFSLSDAASLVVSGPWPAFSFVAAPGQQDD
ncbi:MAG: hypothetical protein ACI9IV_002395 [Paracoccaceae bacterium]|jgi:hypothetical protein